MGNSDNLSGSKWNLKPFFKPKFKPKIFLLNCLPVAEEGPPREVQHRLGEEGAHADHEQDVEDGRAHDRADAHVCSRWRWSLFRLWLAVATLATVWGSGSWARRTFHVFHDSYTQYVL